MSFSFSSFMDSLLSALSYAPVTIKMTAVSFVFGLLFGTIIATIRYYKVPVLSQFFSVFVTVYMGLPTMVALMLYNILFMTYYNDFAKAFNISVPISEVDPIMIGYFTLILGLSCSLSESVRGAFRAIDKTQFEAGYSIGMSKSRTLVRIIYPQMIPILLPGMQNSLIGLLKAVNLVSVISVIEIMQGALLPALLYYSYLEAYVAAALVYWLIGAIIEFLASVLEKNTGSYLKKAIV